MSELTTYRINDSSLGGERILRSNEVLQLDHLIQDKALVPDTRLQAIADAPRCEHGNIYPHDTYNDELRDFGGECEGAPEAAAVLDALEGTDNDD